MAVNRVWFPNAPGGVVNVSQRAQLTLGYGGIIPAVAGVIDYFRRYLQDTATIQDVGAPPSGGATLTPIRETFFNQSQVYTLSNATQINADVFVNGILMLDGEDYTISGVTLTFTNQTIGSTPIIQVHYWVS